MIGTVISRQELLARWAFAESSSSRFGDTVRTKLASAFGEDWSPPKRFADIAESDWDKIVAVLWSVRPADFFERFLLTEFDRFVCKPWSVSELLNCLTLPGFGSVRYFRFLALPPRRAGNGEATVIHPRTAADGIPFSASFVPCEPVIAVPAGDDFVLLEGYLRSILWLRSPIEPLPVWLPLERDLAGASRPL